MSTATAECTTEAAAVEVKSPCRLTQANALVKKYTYWAMGAGVLPVPLLDLAGIAGVQLQLLSDLSKLYGIKFSEHRAKNILGVLMGSIGTGTLLTGAVGSVIKAVPVVGALGGYVALPLVAGGSTYALGKVFVQHFESGGTFLDFDPEKTRQYFAETLKEGQKVAADLKEAGR